MRKVDPRTRQVSGHARSEKQVLRKRRPGHTLAA